MNVVAGFGGSTRNACVALCAGNQVLGVCEQERITRVRGAGVNATGLPDETLDELLRRSGHKRADVVQYAMTDTDMVPALDDPTRLDHHFAHACAAFLPSPFESATVVICDQEAPQISIWDGNGCTLTRVEWPWSGPGFAQIYSRCAKRLGFTGGGSEQRMEALARLESSRHDDRALRLFRLEADRLSITPDWGEQIDGWLTAGVHDRSAVAASLQSHVADLVIDFLRLVSERLPARRQLCVGGSLFLNSHFNTQVKQCGVFDEVFVPINPGDAGLSTGAVLQASGNLRQPLTPFLGPAYSSEEIKGILDNCKLKYQWASEQESVDIAVEALQKGRLVGWFEGSMEWGPRALGARSIVANPFSPYVLENLNRFLKQRDPWRGYALSAPVDAATRYFDGPAASPFMECDYQPRDRRCFSNVLPGPSASVRVQTVGSEAPARFRQLLQAFGAVAGIPVLVNTSFNGFQEPIVCNPRDAVRVFFGTGLDLLVIGEFVIRK